MGPVTDAANAVHCFKHRMPGESFRDVCNRVAQALADNGDHYHLFRSILLSQSFMPGGRIPTGIGTSKQVTPYNCFVSGTINDSFTSGEGSIMQRAHQAAATMRMGGGIGYDFSRLRPRGELIAALQSQASGPVSFMRIYNEVGLVTASSGHRRGAQMGILRVDHPDIEEFILAKHNQDQLTGFNLSIAVTDEFMEAVADDRPFDLRWGGKVYRTIDARHLWELIMRSTWDWAEPGVIFIDRINAENNLAYCETIEATNPCGEQPLPPFGACLLGSFNLTKYLRLREGVRLADSLYWFDYQQLIADIPNVVRAMDNVVDRAIYPLEEQAQEARSKRRIGLGVTGLANAGEALGHPYGTDEFLKFTDKVLYTIKRYAYAASADLAAEKGPFPKFQRDEYCDSPFIRRLSVEVQAAIQEKGIRNSHLISIAPTGTISFCADNVSNGIEPVFSHYTNRPVYMPDGQLHVFEDVPDYAVGQLGIYGRTAMEIGAEEHIAVLTTAQRHVDSSISKTCNVDADMPWENFKSLYFKAWRGGAKSCSTFNTGGKRAGHLEASSSGECASGACEM